MALIGVGSADDDGLGIPLVNAGHIMNALFGSVLSRTDDVGAATATRGNAYIVPASATGAWSGQDGDLTFYDGSAWQFATPDEGFSVWVADDDERVYWTGSAWALDLTADAPSDGNDYVRKDGAWAVASGGGGGSSEVFRGFRARPSSSQSIPSSTVTQLTFDTEDFDTENAFASNSFTVPTSLVGKYMTFTLNMRLNAFENGYFRIYSTTKGEIAWAQVNTNAGLSLTSGPILLETGEVIDADVSIATPAGTVEGDCNFSGFVIESSQPQLSIGSDITASQNVDLADFAQNSVRRHVNSGSAITLTVQSGNTSVGTVTFYREGTGTVTFAAGAGVTIQSESSLLDIANQYQSVTLTHMGSDVYALEGSLA